MKKARNFALTVVGSIVVYETLRRTGALDKIKGNVKTKAGKFLDDPKMQVDGFFDKLKGNAKKSKVETEDWLEDLFD